MSTSLPVINDSTVTRDGLYPGRWWHADGDRIVCDLCPRECSLKEGDRGFCFVRQNIDGQMALTTYGRSTGFCIDPIEKKPLNHFYPGTSVLSFGTAGCNLGCKFCQNWDISKAREVERLSHRAFPDEIALAAKSLGCHSVAYTYNDPIIWAEYAIDTAKACRAEGIKSVAVTAGYICEDAREPFYEFIDAANVDLKAFTEDFYYRITYSHLQPVLDTLVWLRQETDVWFEITNLIIPDANDSPDELRQLCEWVLNAVGDDVPVHFSAFHPDYRMTDRPNTPHETLMQAHEIAKQTGIKYPYVGNVNDVDRQSTYCPSCGSLIIERNWYALGVYGLNGRQCRHCGTEISGHFEAQPGNWGRKRQPVDMRQFHIPRGGPANGHAASSQSAAGPGVTQTSTFQTMTTSTQSVYPQPEKREPAPMAISESTDNGAVKINDSALAWLAGQEDPQPAAPTTPAAPEAPTRMPLTTEQRNGMLQAAGELIAASSEGRQAQIPDLASLGVANASVAGIFTSLKRNGMLRSCCGSFGSTMPLLTTLQQAAHRTATDDPRFPPVIPTELPHLDMEVWLLFAPEKVEAQGEDRVAQVEIGKHGLQIFKGNQRGLLLPGVATDNGWDSEHFLNQVCIKAGLPPTAWKEPDTVLYRFEGNVIKGVVVDEASASAPRLRYQPAQVDELRQICKDNVVAIVRGATPMYYCGTVPDSTVNSVAMIITLPGGGQELDVARLSLKEPMPLQATAFSMCEDLAARLRRRGFLNGNFELDLSIAYDPSMHGTVDKPSLGGIDPRSHAVLITERQKTAWVFDTESTADGLVEAASSACQIREPVYSQLFSLAFQSTRTQETHSALPKAQRGDSHRRPAVAGRFYPGDVTQMNAMLDEMIGDAAEQTGCQAVMVPHAGWQFSGKLAAEVLKQVKLPKRIIAIGPKHTANGVDWAVAPHHTWQVPGESVMSDYELASKLAERIPDLEMDAGAHAAEHGVEVELPIIARLSPETKVVGIAIGGANLQRCEAFAEGLAEVIKELDERPLLLISSDMNHYANEEETRRLDTLALADFDRLDEDALFRTCRENHISMCGMIPAVIIIKTLKKLGGVSKCTPVGYATSASVSGDYDRVVGYAGRILI